MNNRHVKNYQKTFEALVNTLVKKYGKEYPQLIKEQESLPKSALEWCMHARSTSSQLEPMREIITTKDVPALLQQVAPVLEGICLVTLWTNDKLTATSKGYMWTYLENLMEHAKAIEKAEEDESQDISQPPRTDRAPFPPGAGKMPDFGALFKNIDPKVFAQIGEQVAKTQAWRCPLMRTRRAKGEEKGRRKDRGENRSQR